MRVTGTSGRFAGIRSLFSSEPGVLVANPSNRGTAPVPGIFSSLNVKADGWRLQATIDNAEPGGTYAFGTKASPGLALTVSSRSWTTSGTETTISRTVWATALMRQAYPNQASAQETDNGTTITVEFSLSDYVYADDTITACSIASGFFTDDNGGGESNSAESPAVVNNSTLAYPDPFAVWMTYDLEHVTGSTYTAKLAVAHRHFQQGQQVRAVKFTLTDESTNSISEIATSMTSTTYSASGLTVSHYQATISLATLTAEDLVTVDCTIYPWVGDSWTASTDGAAYPSPNMSVIKFLNDKSGTYGISYAYVDSVSGNNGTAVVSETPATAAASPYATVAAAAAGLQTYNNANFSRNNASGGIIRLEEGTHTHGDYDSVAVGEVPMIMEGVPGSTVANVIYDDGGVSQGNSIPDKMLIRNLTLNKTADVIFLSNSGTSGGVHMLVLDGVDITENGGGGYGAWVYFTGRLWVLNCTTSEAADIDLLGLLGASVKETVLVLGCSGTCFTGNSVYNILGSKVLDATLDDSDTAGIVQKSRQLIGWNFLSHNNASGPILEIENPSGGVAVIGNVFEVSNAAYATAVIEIHSSGDQAVTDIVEAANTIIGERSNLVYTNGTADKTGISTHSVHYEWNSKSDVFALNGTYDGNWPWIWRVGSKYRTALTGSAAGDTPGVGNWIGEVAATGDQLGTDASPIDPDWVSDKSRHGLGGGDGDYTPGASTALAQIPAGETGFPFDQKGRAVPTDGTAYVGAIQAAP